MSLHFVRVYEHSDNIKGSESTYGVWIPTWSNACLDIYIKYVNIDYKFVDLLPLSCSSLPMHKMNNTDLNRIIKSEEVQKALRPAK